MIHHLWTLHQHMKTVAEKAQAAAYRGDLAERLAEAQTLHRLVLYLCDIAPAVLAHSGHLLKHAQWFLRMAEEPGDPRGNLRDVLSKDLPALQRTLEQLQQGAIFPPQRVERDEQTCFVAMPFHSELLPIYGEIRAAIAGANLRCERVDEVSNLGPIMQKIWTCIGRAGIMVADLTGYNPNVMYELGLAHAQGTPVVQIAQQMPADTRLPFDVAHINTLFYHPTPEGLGDLRQKLQDRLVGGRQQSA